MGRSVTSKYRVEYRIRGTDGSAMMTTPSCWWTRRDGRATAANLSTHCVAMEKSSQPGGVNAHGKPFCVLSARIVEQSSGDVVAEYTRPMFLAI